MTKLYWYLLLVFSLLLFEGALLCAQNSGIRGERIVDSNAVKVERKDSVRNERRLARSQSAIKELQSDIDGLLRSRDFTNAHLGVSVVSTETGEHLYKLQDSKSFIPASTVKLFTTAAALELLGRDFRYVTRLYLDGTVTNGEFVGNIIIRGSGDPTLSEYFTAQPLDVFYSWVRALDSLGITSIKGNIIGDDSYFDSEHYAPGWMWDDMVYPYSAQVGALNIYDNKITVTISSGNSAGEPARLLVIPENKYARVLNSITTVTQTDIVEINAHREFHSNMIELHGRVPLNTKTVAELYKEEVTVDNPTLYFLNLFKQSLEQNNIRFRGAVLDVDDWNERIHYQQLTPFQEHFSEPLYKIVSVVNKYSHNLCAEILLKTIGKESSGIGSFKEGIEYVTNYLTCNGILQEQTTLVDGSGLSRLNLISPQQLSSLLWSVQKQSIAEDFRNSLSLPGEEGTLRKRLTGSLAEKKLLAKTGSMNNISNLAGYVQTRDGEQLAFAMMFNNFTVPESLARNLQDLVCMRLASFSRR